MISPLNILPSVRFPGGKLAAINCGSLHLSLHHAAEKAGMPKWPHCDPIAKALMHHLLSNPPAEEMSLPVFNELVGTVLNTLDFPEISKTFTYIPAQKVIDLYHFVDPFQPQFELAFFERLKSEVAQALLQKPENLHIRGLKESVKKMAGAKRWRKNCQRLHDEIVEFLHESVTRNAPENLALVIS
ncbi:MAG: hypothetical protein SFY92_06280 [Verrucomicrobiae bacterium]|nr:hypothetical protein [Verrucomicrobiae bacterium]